jgi:lipopolysaccharide export system ATP-binding protein
VYNAHFGNKNIFAQARIALKTAEIIGFFGRNGTGKSTFFKILFGIMKAEYLELYLDGQPCTQIEYLNLIIGYHPQEIMLPKNVTVKTLIAMYIKDGEGQNKVHYAHGIADI